MNAKQAFRIAYRMARLGMDCAAMGKAEPDLYGFIHQATAAYWCLRDR